MKFCRERGYTMKIILGLIVSIVLTGCTPSKIHYVRLYESPFMIADIKANSCYKINTDGTLFIRCIRRIRVKNTNDSWENYIETSIDSCNEQNLVSITTRQLDKSLVGVDSIDLEIDSPNNEKLSMQDTILMMSRAQMFDVLCYAAEKD